MNPADIIRIKELLPTSLGSAEYREQVARDILRRSIVSARMESARHLARVRDVCAQVAAGEINQADATLALTRSLEEIGFSPQDGESLANPASRARIELVVKTQRQMASSVARIQAQTEDSLDDFPAWELRRFAGRRAPREDWDRRWRAAGDAVGWEGACRHTGDFPEWGFVALKGSPIWAALGRGAGGFGDALGNPYPPFAYGSGLDWEDVDRARAEELGLIGPGEAARAPEAQTLAPSGDELAEASQRLGIGLSGGVQ